MKRQDSRFHLAAGRARGTTLALLVAGLLGGGPLLAGPEEAQAAAALLGGGTTVRDATSNAFSRSAANLPAADLPRFAFGNRIFNTTWVTAPASPADFDGLGPLFNRVSCSSCHVRDGRGRPPEPPGFVLLSMLLRLSVPGQAADGGPRPHPVYGGQLQDRAILGVRPEGKVRVTYQEREGAFPDGERYSLRKPRFEVLEPAYGPLGEDVLISPRVAPALIGLGLLEVVPEAEVLALADESDRDGDGISGRPNRVASGQSGGTASGRFGWKAGQPTLRRQAALAFQEDIGITSSLYPDDGLTAAEREQIQGSPGGTPELRDDFLDRIEFYLRTLAVPARRGLTDGAAREGEKVFAEIGCGACHVATLRTGESAVPALARQTIHPYTDLLLHDLGQGLADERPEFEASGREWRTPPLWGIGLLPMVNGHTLLLHDGRARNLSEAILWHGGEADASRRRFEDLPAPRRKHLLAFLESL